VSALISVLNGPNLNLLGVRQPEVYGLETLADIERRCRAEGDALELRIDFHQTNAEFELLTQIHAACSASAGIVINPGALAHSSVVVMEALSMCQCPVIEVHISNVYRREAFRHFSYASRAATGVICGLGTNGYVLAVRHIAQLLRKTLHVA
jgi:3-dehydroquinate dehydratase II